jgi:hypothetical protein
MIIQAQLDEAFIGAQESIPTGWKSIPGFTGLQIWALLLSSLSYVYFLIPCALAEK